MIREKNGSAEVDMTSEDEPLSRIPADTMPPMLPEEVLAAEPYRQPPSEAIKLATQGSSSAKKHILFQSKEKPPKTIRKGPVRVKVLEWQNPSLPPRASRAGQALRESWLAGRSRKGGGPAVERREINRGFLKRREL